jgi:hypothetical protein
MAVMRRERERLSTVPTRCSPCAALDRLIDENSTYQA